MAPVDIMHEGQVCAVTLNRAERHNSLTLPFMLDIEGALKDAISSDARLILLKATGKSFSTGGDIKGFLENSSTTNTLSNYANKLVSSLNRALMTIIQARQPVLVAAQGLVTGGAAGFLFASDYCVMADHAFLQPYYGEVGFAPDGGWTALLPQTIGHRQAMGAILQNQRISAQDALQLGIVNEITNQTTFDLQVSNICRRILSQDLETLSATKQLIWPNEKRERSMQALEAEKQAFLKAIQLPNCKTKMQAFVTPNKVQPQTGTR